MMQILPKIPSFSENFAQQITQGLGSGLSQANQFAQQMALEKVKAKNLAHETKHLERVKNIETGLGTIQKMRQLISSAGPSNFLQSFLGVGDVRKNRAELEKLGTSLIPLAAAGIPVRNQREFDKYSSIITNPNARQEDIEGALNAMEDIFSRSLDSEPEQFERKKSASSQKQKQKFDARNPKHKSRVDQVLKKTKGDRKKAEEVLNMEFDLG